MGAATGKNFGDFDGISGKTPLQFPD